MPFTVIRKGIAESLISEVVDLRVLSGMVQYTLDGTTWIDLTELGQIVSVVAETLDAGEDATASLEEGILNIGIPRGADGADGANGLDGAPGAPGADGANTEPLEFEYASLYAPVVLQTTVLAAAAKFVLDLTPYDDYSRIKVYTHLRSTANAASDQIHVFANADTTAANYHHQDSSGANGLAGISESDSLVWEVVPALTSTAAAWSDAVITLVGPRRTDQRKNIVFDFMGELTADNQRVGKRMLVWQSNAAIDTLTIRTDNDPTDLFAIGSYILVVGYKTLNVVTGGDGHAFMGPPGADGNPGAPGAPGECECEEIPTQPDGAMNRCGIAVAVTSKLKEIYGRVKLDPDGWDILQDAAGAAVIGGSALTTVATIAPVIFGAAFTLTGVGLFGIVVGGVGTLASIILGLFNDNSDQFTPTREEYLQAALYCVLTRRETTDLTAEALREWISYIADAGFPEADREIIIGVLGWVPLQYWKNEALVAPPKINPCISTTCASRDTAFVYQFSGIEEVDHMQFDDALPAATMTVLAGKRDGSGIHAVAMDDNVRYFNIRVHLGRIVPISGIEIEVAYKQTDAVLLPLITLIGDGMVASATVNDVSEDFATVNWEGLASVSEFIIAGSVATTGDFDEDAYLDLIRLKICGDGWPTWGVSMIGGDPCESPVDPCVEWTDVEWCHTVNFRLDQRNWSAFQGGTYIAGQGWRTTTQTLAGEYWVRVGIHNTGITSALSTVYKRARINWSQPTDGQGGNAQELHIAGQYVNLGAYMNQIGAELESEWAGTVDAGAVSGVDFRHRTGYRVGALPNPQGEMTAHSITFGGNGPEPNWNEPA